VLKPLPSKHEAQVQTPVLKKKKTKRNRIFIDLRRIFALIEEYA
jgi:hypothetical protein